VANYTIKHGAARHSKHGSVTKEYNAWAAMLKRCRNPSHPLFPRWGGRGITVCERWEKYEQFIADLGPRPQGHTLERINNDGNYEPGNVRWATPADQQRNTRRTRFLTHQDVTLCITDWAARLGFKTSAALSKRLRNGWSVSRALTTPADIRYRRSKRPHNHAATASRIEPDSVEP
jgi:hypothetical protein